MHANRSRLLEVARHLAPLKVLETICAYPHLAERQPKDHNERVVEDVIEVMTHLKIIEIIEATANRRAHCKSNL